MTRRGSADVGFLLSGGYNLLGTTTTLRDSKEAVLEETTPLGVADETYAAVGLKRGRITQDGFYDDDTDKSNDAMVGLAQRVLAYGLEGNTIGKAFVGMAGAIQHVYHRIASRGEFHKANAEYTATGAVEDGKIIHAHTEETAASGDTESTPVDGGMQADAVTITSSSVDNPTVITTAAPHDLLTGDTVLIAGHSGSTPDINDEWTVTVLTPTTYTIPVQVTTGGTGGTSTRISSRGGAGYLEVSALTLGGYTDVTVKIKDCPDDVTYVDLIEFANVSSAPDAERKTEVGAVERYVAMSWAFNGSGSDPKITLMVGLARN